MENARVRRVVFPQVTTTSIYSSSNPASAGTSITLMAAVAPGWAPGSVEFFDGTASLGSVVVSGGAASLSGINLSAGSHSVTAVYSGGPGFSGSTSPVLNQVITKTNSTTTLYSNPNPSLQGQSVTFTAYVASGPVIVGNVSFYDGSSLLGTSTLTAGSASWTAVLSPGAHSLTAVYSGSATYNGSTSPVLVQTVKFNTTTNLAAAPNPSGFGQAITFTATVSPGPAGWDQSVWFYEGSTCIGTATLNNAVATWVTSSLTLGSHSITAVYMGSGTHNISQSAPVVVTVNKANTTTIVTSSRNPSVRNQAVTFIATVSSSAATGTVQFRDGSTVLGTGSLSNGAASFTTASLSVATHSITAVYSGDVNHNGSTSAALSQVVQRK